MINLSDIIASILPPKCPVCSIRTSQTVCFRCWPNMINFNLSRCKVCFDLLDLTEENTLCQKCQIKKPVFNSLKYLWQYKGKARDYITTMKYQTNRKLCREAGKLIADHYSFLFPQKHDLIIPVPSSAKTLHKRLFNQCDYLVKSISGKILFNGLTHLGYKTPQAGLNYRERIKNVANVFRARKNFNGQKILLVDDVFTTGATVNSATLALYAGGARMVDIFILAKRTGAEYNA